MNIKSLNLLKSFLLGIAAVAILGLAAVNVSLGQKNDFAFGVILKNAESLASNESGGSVPPYGCDTDFRDGPDGGGSGWMLQWDCKIGVYSYCQNGFEVWYNGVTTYYDNEEIHCKE